MFRTYFTSSFSGLPGTIVFRGYIDCSGDPNYPAAISGDMYVVSVAGRIGGASGVLVEIGDQITCITDNAGGTQVAVGNDFSIAQANITYVPENAALKDTANGYPGLTSFKINFLNFLGTFTSYFQNTNTASRLYSFQDRDGTIADNTDLALKQDLSGKDASNGYPGLTLFKINFKNVANTFTSFFTNSNTAARTYTFQDRTDTIADLTDIAGVLTTQTLGNLINSATAKTTPVDADMLPLMDSAAGNITKKLSWLNVKATLKTYFDTLYESLVNKDASGGYVGLTLFKINFKNAANTFTSFFTNANTAARTYTFQNRDGTIADNTDLAGKLTNVLTSGNIFVGNGSNVATGVAMSGDVTISNAGVTAIGSGKVTEAMQILADNTTQNVSTTKHGYAPKAPNDNTKYLDGTGAWSVPASSTPVGAEIFFDNSNPDTPALPAQFVQANGQTISDASSPYNGKRIRNLNGATVSSVTVTSLDNTAKTVTVSTNDIYAFMVGDSVTFTGVTVANGVIKAVNYGTGVITIGDVTTWTSGNYDTTTETLTGATAITSVGLKRFARGNSANTGGGGVNTFQGYALGIGNRGFDVASTAPFSYIVATNTLDSSSGIINNGFYDDGTNGTPRTGTDTQPNYFDGVWIKKIK